VCVRLPRPTMGPGLMIAALFRHSQLLVCLPTCVSESVGSSCFTQPAPASAAATTVDTAAAAAAADCGAATVPFSCCCCCSPFFQVT
jgi:hypothetical protein